MGTLCGTCGRLTLFVLDTGAGFDVRACPYCDLSVPDNAVTDLTDTHTTHGTFTGVCLLTPCPTHATPDIEHSKWWVEQPDGTALPPIITTEDHDR